MSKSQEVVKLVLGSTKPLTSREIADALKFKQQYVATVLWQQHRAGKLNRVVLRKGLTGADVFGYSKPENHVVQSEKHVVQAEDIEAVAKPSKAKASSLDALVEEIAAQIVNRLVGSVKRRLPSALERIVPAQQEVVHDDDFVALLDNVLAESTPKPPALLAKQTKPASKMLKIGIVGLLPQQAGLISTEFGETFDLSFWNEDGNGRLKSMGVGCDRVLVTKWVAHKTTEVLTSVGANWRKVVGGMDELRTILTSLYVEGV